MTKNDGIERIRAAQRRRWAAVSPQERSAHAARIRYAADLRWERQADPDGSMTPEQRAVAGARLRDQHYRDLGVVSA